MTNAEVPARFLRLRVITERGCWEYTGYRNRDGYVKVWWKGRRVFLHRLVYALAHGRVPSGKLVTHECDNPPCFNPDHLHSGTHSTNLKHQYQRGRRKPKELIP